jgi:hypothetical protein
MFEFRQLKDDKINIRQYYQRMLYHLAEWLRDEGNSDFPGSRLFEFITFSVAAGGVAFTVY